METSKSEFISDFIKKNYVGSQGGELKVYSLESQWSQEPSTDLLKDLKFEKKENLILISNHLNVFVYGCYYSEYRLGNTQISAKNDYFVYIEKIDSTGLVSDCPKGLASLTISALIKYLQELLSSFQLCVYAATSDQYLFPLSSKSTFKNIKSDRGLIGWWIKALSSSSTREPQEPPLERYCFVPGETMQSSKYLFSGLPDSAQWIWGFGVDGTQVASTVLPSFPDDLVTKALEYAPSEKATVFDLQEVMGVLETHAGLRALLRISFQPLQEKNQSDNGNASTLVKQEDFSVKVLDVLLKGEFDSVDSATSSTKEFLDSVKTLGLESSSFTLVPSVAPLKTDGGSEKITVHSISGSLVKKKTANINTITSSMIKKSGQANTINASLIKKKPLANTNVVDLKRKGLESDEGNDKKQKV